MTMPSDTNGADPERMIGRQTAQSGELAQKPAGLAYWATYPLTAVEAALMALVSGLSYALLRAVYVRWSRPGDQRPRPRRMVKEVIDAENALAAMQTIERIAQDSRAGIFWISGTLLGLERLGQPLPHDNDLDVGLFMDDPHCEDFLAALRASSDVTAMAPQRVSWTTRIQNPDLRHLPRRIIRYKAAVRNPQAPEKPAVKLDIFLHFPYRGGSMHGTRNSLWWNTTQPVVKKLYAGGEFSVPADAHLYLLENYGNYREEVKEFENTIDCPNVLDIFSWRSLGTLLSRLQMMLKMGRVDRARQINQRIISTILKGVMPVSPTTRFQPAPPANRPG